MNRRLSYWTAVAFLILAIVGRFAGLPQNFWLFGAATLFAGCYLRGPFAFLLPIGALGLSDCIGHLTGYRGMHLYYGWTMLFNYLALSAFSGCGMVLRNRDSMPAAIGGAFAGSILFFLISNFAAWLDPHLGYAGSLGGIIACYTAGIPFYQNTLASDLFFTFLMFGCHHGLHSWLRETQLQPSSNKSDR